MYILQEPNTPSPIQLTNSVRLFDKHRIKHTPTAAGTTQPSSTTECPYRYGMYLHLRCGFRESAEESEIAGLL